MNREAVLDALTAIHDEALRPLQRDDLPNDVEEGLNLILALSHYEADIRSVTDIQAAEPNGDE